MTRRLAAFVLTAATVTVLGTAATFAAFAGLSATQRVYAGVGWGCIGVAVGLAVVFGSDPPPDGEDDG